MWISSKEYRELYDRTRKRANEYDDLIAILSEVVIQIGNGQIKIKSPALNGKRTLNWSYEEDRQIMVINSKGYGIPERSLEKKE